MRQLILVATAIVMLVSATELRAQGPRWVGPFGRAPVAPNSKQAAIGAYGKAVYPKYHWGLHGREFQNVGVPHGDIGILGSGVSRDPW